jgi:hypothetical protein
MFFIILLVSEITNINLAVHLSNLKKYDSHTPIEPGLNELKKSIIPKRLMRFIMLISTLFIVSSLFFSFKYDSFIPSWAEKVVILQFVFYIVSYAIGIWYFYKLKNNINTFESQLKSLKTI